MVAFVALVLAAVVLVDSAPVVGGAPVLSADAEALASAGGSPPHDIAKQSAPNHWT
jgi:hypothetical protein